MKLIGADVGGTKTLLELFEVSGAQSKTLREDHDLVSLNPRVRDPKGVAAVLGAGTGLGQATLVRSEGGGVHVIASEGGHASFAPRNELQSELLRFLSVAASSGRRSRRRRSACPTC